MPSIKTVQHKNYIKDTLAHLVENLTQLSINEARQFLINLIQTGKPTDLESNLKLNLARMLFVERNFEDGLKEGKLLLGKAQRYFVELSKKNKSARFLIWDIKIILGNLYCRYGQFRKGIDFYLSAIFKEKNIERKVIGVLNIARAYVATGENYKALNFLERALRVKVEDQRLMDYVSLLKSRILLTIGYGQKAFSIVSNIHEQAILDAKVLLEKRYLELHCKIRMSDFKDTKTLYETFLNWLLDFEQGKYYSFYELEWLVTGYLCPDFRVKNHSHFRMKYKQLAKALAKEDFRNLLTLFERFFDKKKSTKMEFLKVLNALDILAEHNNHQMFVLIEKLLGDRLLALKQFSHVSLLVNHMNHYRDQILSGFPASWRRENQKDDLFLIAASLEANIPNNSELEEVETLDSLLR